MPWKGNALMAPGDAQTRDTADGGVQDTPINDYELVRAKAPRGPEFTTTRAHAAASGLKVLDGKPATNQYGTPLPAKPDAGLHDKEN